MKEVKSGDVVVLQMDDELMIVHSVTPDGESFFVDATQSDIHGEYNLFYHEYKTSDIMTIYRAITN